MPELNDQHRRAERTGEVLDAMGAVAAFIREHGLHLGGIEITPGSPTARRWDPETRAWTRPVLPRVDLFHFSSPREFARWCAALGISTMRVQRRDLDVCLHTSIDRDGITWQAHTSVPRYEGKALPGITVDWDRRRSGRRGDTATISVADLQVSLDTTEES